MKKILLGLFVGFYATESLSMDLAIAVGAFSGPQKRETDPRPLVNQLQLALLESVEGVYKALFIAEGSYNDGGYSTETFSGIAGSFAGLSDISVGPFSVINFTFDPAEINSKLSLGTVVLTYAPHLGQGINSWDCTVSNPPALGSNFVMPSVGELYPVTKGLGWPYEECTIAPAS